MSSLDIVQPLERPGPLWRMLGCRKEHLEKNWIPKTTEETNDTVASDPMLYLFHLIDNDMFSPVSGILEVLLDQLLHPFSTHNPII